MGLDMYALKTREPIGAVDFKEPEESVEFFRWRKHPNLHGWMEALYFSKGGSKVFNCASVRLEPADLDRLEADVRAGALPDTTGFFFGVSQPEDKEDDLSFIRRAREAFEAGYQVFYSSWW